VDETLSVGLALDSYDHSPPAVAGNQPKRQIFQLAVLDRPGLGQAPKVEVGLDQRLQLGLENLIYVFGCSEYVADQTQSEGDQFVYCVEKVLSRADQPH
jgi:hypothetical protein